MRDYIPTPLEQIYGVGDMQGGAMARGIQEQGLRSTTLANDYSAANNPQKLREQELKNIFSEQENPLKIQNQSLINQGLVNTNRTGAVNADIAEQTKQYKLNDAQRQEVLNASEHDIKRMAIKAQEMLYSNDPLQIERGKKLMMLSQESVMARQKHAEAKAIVEIQRRSQEKIAAGNNAATMYGADQRAASAQARQGLVATLEADLAKAKSPDHAANIYDSYARKAMMAGDDALAAELTSHKTQALANVQAKAEAAARVAAGNQIDYTALNKGLLARQSD